MYGASERFNEIILGNSRQFKAKIKVGEKEISTGFRSVRQYAQSSDAGYVSIGGAVSSYIEVEMWKPEVTLENAEIEVSIGLLVDGEPEYVPLGLYTVLKPQNDDGVIRFTAYDRIQSKMSGAYFSELSYPADGKDLLKEISTKTGVSIDVSNLPDGVKIANRAVITETGVDENGDVTTTTTYEAPFNGYTYREALGYIAQLYGKFATANRTGTIVFRGYEETEYEINPNRYYDDLVTAESVFKVEAITCQVGEQSLKAGTGVENIQLENPVMTQECLDAVYELVKDLQFLPASLSFFGDIRLDLGDIVTVNDKYGNIVKVPVMNVSQDFDGGLLTRIQSNSAIGQDESVKGPTVQKLDRMYTDLFLVKEIVGQKASFDYVHAIDADFQNVRGDFASFKVLTADSLSALTARIDSITATDITVDYLEANYAQVDLANIKDGCITTAMIGQGVVDTAQIADGSITDAKIVELTANKITAGILSVERLEIRGSTNSIVYALNSITGALQAQNVDTLNGEALTQRTITADKIVANAITANEIAAKTITANNIAAKTITANNIAANTITSGEIAAGAIKAVNIDVVDLFAQDITATGTIKGLKLEGATGSFTGNVAANSLSLQGTSFSVENCMIETPVYRADGTAVSSAYTADMLVMSGDVGLRVKTSAQMNSVHVGSLYASTINFNSIEGTTVNAYDIQERGVSLPMKYAAINHVHADLQASINALNTKIVIESTNVSIGANVDFGYINAKSGYHLASAVPKQYSGTQDMVIGINWTGYNYAIFTKTATSSLRSLPVWLTWIKN